jgi:hypothetical protein
MADSIANSQNAGREFMAQNLRVGRAGKDVRLFWGYDRPRDVFMQIGAADAGDQGRNQHIIRQQLARWFRDILDPDIFCAVKSNCSHRICSSKAAVPPSGW